MVFAEEIPGRGRRPMKPLVLIVEDEAALVTLLHYNLEKEGFRVASAGDGEEALLRSTRSCPTSSCSTGCCRSVSGIEVCRRLRRRTRPRNCRSSC